MPFKRLRQFVKFDTNAFLAKKKLMCFACEPLLENREDGTSVVVGSKYTVTIVEDHTHYQIKDGATPVTNAGQALTVKVVGIKPEPIVQPFECRIVGANAKVYGEYQNNLSIKADAVEPINNGKQ